MSSLPDILVALLAAAVGYAAWALLSRRGGGVHRRVRGRLFTESARVGSAARGGVDLANAAPEQFLARLVRRVGPDLPPVRFASITAGAALVGGLLVGALAFSVAAGLAAAIAAGAVPILWARRRQGQRRHQAALQLPEALEFLSRVLQAGHSMSTGFQLLGNELPAPLGAEFRRAHDQHSLGQPVEQVLQEMATRMQSRDFGFVVTSIVIQRQTGGDLGQVLRNIAQMIRERIRLAHQVRARTAEGRLTGYILTAFPVLIFVLTYLINPEYAGLMFESAEGLGMLTVALTLQAVGLLLIRRITRVEV